MVLQTKFINSTEPILKSGGGYLLCGNVEIVESSVPRIENLFFITYRAQTTTFAAATAMGIKAVDFEVHGKVQGVFFRKYTKEQAERLNLRGWCKNTPHGTVQGHMQGPPQQIETMMDWLKNTGSPSSKIEKAVFKNQKEISEYTFDNFGIIRS